MEQYWATKTDDIASEIMSRVEDNKKYLEKTGLIQELRRSYRTFYGDTQIKTIDQSLKAIHINHYANLIRHVLVDVTSQRPAWEARAINTDLESQADTQLATGLLDYYMREKQIEATLNEAIEKCLFMREGWISVGWNVTSGEVYGTNPDDGMPIYEGDIEVKSHSLLDVYRDFRQKDMKHAWHIVREYENKWDLSAKFPELAEKISMLSIDMKNEAQYEINNERIWENKEYKTDLIPVYTLWHAKTPSMPDGRMVKVLNDEIVLFDGKLPYKKVYLFPVTSSVKLDTSYGHSNMMDLLPIQEAFNATVSAILTNQAANAVQNFQAPKGAAPRVTSIMDGLNVWEYDPKAGKLEAMDLLKTAPEVFNFANFLQNQAEQIGGVPPISKGVAPATMSGTAMALLAQQAIQFSSGVQLSRTLLQEALGTAIIELLQTYAVVPRIAMIVGKSKRSQMKSFQGSDLKGIGRVFCDTANPLTKTSAGRVEIANQLLATPGMIKTPEQYINVLTTGNLEPLYEHDQAIINLIKSENEWLLEGKMPQVLMTDDDATHVLEHSCVANSPEARENPTVMNALLNHIQFHIEQAKSKDPALAAMLKQASFIAPPMLPPEQAGPPQGSGPSPVMNSEPSLSQQASNVNLPKPAEPPQINESGVL